MHSSFGNDWEYVVWLQTSFLGDIVLSTAAFQLFKDKFPKKKQYLITTSLGASALKNHPALDGIIVFNKNGLAIQGMKKVKVDLKGITQGSNQGLILQAHKSFRSMLLSRYLNLPIVTYRQSSGSFLANLVVERIAVLHEAVRIALLLEPLGLNRENLYSVKPTLPRAEKSSEKIMNFLSQTTDSKTVALVPGSVWYTKKWPAQAYAELARWLIQNNWRVLVIGSANELADARVIDASAAPLAKQGQYINLVGKTNLDDLRYIYPRLDLVICNDSSSLHYASAFAIPSLSIFGSTVPAMGFGPLGEKVLVVEHETLSCRPCSDHGPNRCPLGHFRCMLEIGPQRLIQAVQQMEKLLT